VNIEVRPLRDSDDATAIGALVQRAYFALPGYPRDPEYDASLADVAGRAAEAVVVVAVADGVAVGCVTYVPEHTNPHAEHDDPAAASFRAFAVDPAVQGQGVGRALLDWISAEARRTGRARVRIHTLESMPGAQRLYAHYGYVRDPDGDEDWDGIKGLAYVLHL
jgi:GNAT superfamily N-acetyltransferase